MVDPKRHINILSPEEQAFLEECENEFANRFTELDPEFMAHCKTPSKPPPIICPWNSRWPGGGGGGGGGGWRGDRRFNDERHGGQRPYHNSNYRRPDYRGRGRSAPHRNYTPYGPRHDDRRHDQGAGSSRW